MPEQLTKHPEVTLQVLRSAGAKCGDGAPQDILTQCPAQSFCKLPSGEVCIYGLPEASRMTQLSKSDWQVVQEALMPSQAARPATFTAEGLSFAGAGLAVGLLLGLVVARVWRQRA